MGIWVLLALLASLNPSISTSDAFHTNPVAFRPSTSLSSSTTNVISTTPIPGMKPGTSGLRKKTQVWMETPYLENFVQSLLNIVLKDGPVDR